MCRVIKGIVNMGGARVHRIAERRFVGRFALNMPMQLCCELLPRQGQAVIGQVLFRWFDIDIERKARPVVEAYYQRLAKRSSYREMVMVSYDALRAEGA